jgi:hypothetical protein
MASEQELATFRAIRDIASVLVTSAEAYNSLIVRLEDSNIEFSALRREALSTGLLAAQVQTGALEALQEMKQQIAAPYHPPLSAILALGSIACSLILIAAVDQRQGLADVELLSLDSLGKILASKAVDNWLRTCLGSG